MLLNKYPLFDPIRFPTNYPSWSIKIAQNGDVYVTAEEEIHIGKITTYDIPMESLEYHKDGIYVLKESLDYERIAMDNIIYSGMLELSNLSYYNLLSALLRMYYILMKLDNNYIVNYHYKKEMLKSIIDRMINIENHLSFSYSELIVQTVLPYLKYDY